MITLKERLAGWHDWDVAEHNLAVCLGLMQDGYEAFQAAKYVFWTNHPIGEALYQMLVELAKVGVLEHDQEGSRFRWNQD